MCDEKVKTIDPEKGIKIHDEEIKPLNFCPDGEIMNIAPAIKPITLNEEIIRMKRNTYRKKIQIDKI